LSYPVKFVVILGIVAVVSFFTASVVIPEKNAVAPSGRNAKKTLTPPPIRGGDILVVVADGKPAEKPIMVSGSADGPVPLDHEALAPVDDAEPAPVAPPEPKVVLADARPALPGPPPPVAKPAPAAAEAATAPAETKTAPAAPTPPPEPFATNAVYVAKTAAPQNTMAAFLAANAAPVTTAKPAPAAATFSTITDTATKAPAAAIATTTPAAATTPATPPPVKPAPANPNAPLGYKLASTAVCASIENRVPKGITDRFSKDAGAVYYFTHFVGAVDSAAVLHRWYREGKLIQTSILWIKSSSWRTHSKRNLTTVDEPAGNWRVEVIDQKSGKLLETASFVVE
jgi:hypothetical protein